MCSLAAAFCRRCFAQSMQFATNWIVLESITWITRLKRRGNPRYVLPPNEGVTVRRCSSTAQNRSSANCAERVRLAWENVLRTGGVAPRMADNLARCRLMPSQTLFRPIACATCAYSNATMWLHGVKVRACESTPCSRASFATRWPGIN